MAGNEIKIYCSKQTKRYADTINISKKFLGKSNFCLMLGDNFFYGGNFSGHLDDCQKQKII